MSKTLSVTGLLMLLAASSAWAQGPEIEIGALGGLYLPVTDVEDSDVRVVTQKSAAAFGGRISLWLTEMFGVEGEFAYALSDPEDKIGGVDFCEEDGENVCDSNVWLGSVKGLYRFMSQPDANWALHLGAGVGVIGHGGDYWEFTDGTTDIGGVLNAGLTVDVTPNIAIRVDAEDYLYSAKFEDDGEETESKFQNDLLLLGGISFKIGGGM